MVRLLGRCLPIICLSRKKRQSLPICEQNNGGTKHHQDEINKLFVRRVESIRVTQQGAIFKRLPCQTLAERQQQKKMRTKERIHRHEKVIKPDDTEFDCETHISDRQSKQKARVKSKKKSKDNDKTTTSSHPGTPAEKPSHLKTKGSKSRSPSPSSIDDILEEDKSESTNSSLSSTSSISSDWSTTTYPDSQNSEKSEELIMNPIQRRQSMPLANGTNRNDPLKHRSCVESFYLGREHVRASSSPSQTKASSRAVKEERSKADRRNQMKSPGKSKQVLQNVRKMIKDQSIQEQHFNDTQQRESVRL
ncbi:unnamed protein product [Adineta ricciae]|uniref:Uncharacterized protein n=1 Tax=Adineta ricciae TaxID=249248 RepID=A0A814S7Z6_ADIRI|nr:unnamed protein product [Adineta ricciae]CAF1290952.1 unnamed protein product [Adineta ricciae]